MSELGEIEHLIGSRCKKCGDGFYPKRFVCLGCGGRQLEDVALENIGEIWSYTIARQKPEFSFVEVPSVIAIIKLPGDVLVQSIIDNCELDAVAVGMKVKLATRKVSKDAEGNDIVAFSFMPL
jgi:uncharacterized OB-fold protein